MPNGPITKVGSSLGVAAYKSGDFAKANEALRRSLRTDHLDLQENTYYDLGNVLYRMGQQTLPDVPEQTKEQWQQAIALYESALKLAPKDADAIYNRDLVKRKLAELERQQQQQPQNQKQSQQQKKSSSKSGQQGKQDSQNQQNQQNGQAAQKPSQPASQTNQKNQMDQSSQQAQRNPQGQGQPKPDQRTGDGKHPQARPDQPGQAQPPSPTAEKTTAAPQPASARPNADDRQPTAEPEVPGKLSQRDARQLLDALRGDERIMPVGPEGKRHMDDDVVRRDW
jgi:hypothetical protein